MQLETFLTTADVDRIRADERRATVERIRERLHTEGFWYLPEIDAILDEEAAR
jgi:hypothetical protein